MVSYSFMKYASPMGQIDLVAKDGFLCGAYFHKEPNQPQNLQYGEPTAADLKVLKQAEQWLDEYFGGKKPKTGVIPVKFHGTEFQKQVWAILLTIPYGKTKTYGEIAKIVAKQRGKSKMSAQAVGNAVGANPISIIVPCHRVIGSDGSLVGYGGGLDRKLVLLEIEATK